MLCRRKKFVIRRFLRNTCRQIIQYHAPRCTFAPFITNACVRRHSNIMTAERALRAPPSFIWHIIKTFLRKADIFCKADGIYALSAHLNTNNFYGQLYQAVLYGLTLYGQIFGFYYYFIAAGAQQPVGVVHKLIVVLYYVALFLGHIVARGHHLPELYKPLECG